MCVMYGVVCDYRTTLQTLEPRPRTQQPWNFNSSIAIKKLCVYRNSPKEIEVQ
jgi:hypothetical protein